MITREQFEQLEALDAGNNLVLSTYLDLDPERQVRRAYRIVFEDLTKEACKRLDESRRAALTSEAARRNTPLPLSPARAVAFAFPFFPPRR